MDIKAIRNELRMLSEIVDGWSAQRDVSPLERDMVLEKLRQLYEQVRFPEAVSALPEPEPEMSVSIDLDEVLLADLSIGEVVDHVFAAEAEVPPVSAPDQAPTGFAGDDRDPNPAPVVETDAAAQPAAGAAQSVSPEVSAQPEIPAAPANLFGIEVDETERHRRKQRVIMSLYQNAPPASPATAQVSAPTSAPEPAPEPIIPAPGPISAPETDSNEDFEEFTVETAPATDPQGEMAPEDETFDDEPQPEPASDAGTRPTASVLGDVINHDMQTLADTFAPRRDTLSEAAHRSHIADLRAAIGINDRFLLVRDLFDGDSKACDAALDALDAFGNLDDCVIYIAENYSWNPNSDGVKLIMELLERKHT